MIKYVCNTCSTEISYDDVVLINVRRVSGHEDFALCNKCFNWIVQTAQANQFKHQFIHGDQSPVDQLNIPELKVREGFIVTKATSDYIRRNIVNSSLSALALQLNLCRETVQVISATDVKIEVADINAKRCIVTKMHGRVTQGALEFIKESLSRGLSQNYLADQLNISAPIIIKEVAKWRDEGWVPDIEKVILDLGFAIKVNGRLTADAFQYIKRNLDTMSRDELSKQLGIGKDVLEQLIISNRINNRTKVKED